MVGSRVSRKQRNEVGEIHMLRKAPSSHLGSLNKLYSYIATSNPLEPQLYCLIVHLELFLLADGIRTVPNTAHEPWTATEKP